MRIETDRLILRKPDPERDFDPWAEAMADPGTVKYLGVEPMSRPQSWRSLAMVLGHWEIRGFGFFSIEHRKTGEWLGRVGPWYPRGWLGREVGWTLHPSHLRRGYALEAARASVDYAFSKLGWSRVVHVIMDGNEPSFRLAKKLGSQLLDEQQGIEGVTDERVFIYGQERT